MAGIPSELPFSPGTPSPPILSGNKKTKKTNISGKTGYSLGTSRRKTMRTDGRRSPGFPQGKQIVYTFNKKDCDCNIQICEGYRALPVGIYHETHHATATIPV